MNFSVDVKRVSWKWGYKCEACEKRVAEKKVTFKSNSRVHLEFVIYLCSECTTEMRKDAK